MTKELATSVETTNRERTLRFTISTSAPDRANDTIAASGWRLDAYRKNPIVLWSHSRDMLPIAKTTDIRVVANKLVATAEFVPAKLHPFAGQVFDLLRSGFLNGSSVGFKPLKWSKNAAGGTDYQEQILLEWSVTPVPCHAEALLETRTDRAAVLKWLASKPSGREIVFRLKPDALPLPKYRVDPAMLASALAVTLRSTLDAPAFKAQLRSTVDARVAAAFRRMRGRLD
jgi:HK97 family phage prohead protease